MNQYQGQVLGVETDAPPGDLEVWSGPLADGALAVLLLNRGELPSILSATWEMLELEPGSSDYVVRDLWAQAAVKAGPVGIQQVLLPPHGTAMYRVETARRR